MSEKTNSAESRESASVEIRQISPEDVEALKQFHLSLSNDTVKEFYHCAGTRELTAEAREAKAVEQSSADPSAHTYLAAWQDGKIVGLLDLAHGPNATEVSQVVHQDYRHRGIATALMAEAVRLADERGLRLYAIFNDASQKIGRKFGFGMELMIRGEAEGYREPMKRAA